MENQNRYRNFCAVILFFSSWVLIFLTAGIVVEDWVHLNTENMPNTKNMPISHSPWKISKDELWQGDNTENIRIMMGIILSLAFFYNFFLGLGFTYMIPHNEHSCFTSIVLSFLTGMFLLITLLAYHYNIKQGHHRFSNYKLTWITFINYVNVFILITSGILSLLVFSSGSFSLNTIHVCSGHIPKEVEVMETSTSDAIPEQKIPRSIVHRHSSDQTEHRPQVQVRRVTWAL